LTWGIQSGIFIDVVVLKQSPLSIVFLEGGVSCSRNWLV
jgi:hypothetical protein